MRRHTQALLGGASGAGASMSPPVISFFRFGFIFASAGAAGRSAAGARSADGARAGASSAAGSGSASASLSLLPSGSAATSVSNASMASCRPPNASSPLFTLV